MIRRRPIQHPPDMAVARNPLHAEQRPGASAPRLRRQQALMRQKRRALHEKHRKRRKPDVSHGIARVASRALVGHAPRTASPPLPCIVQDASCNSLNHISKPLKTPDNSKRRIAVPGPFVSPHIQKRRTRSSIVKGSYRARNRLTHEPLAKFLPPGSGEPGSVGLIPVTSAPGRSESMDSRCLIRDDETEQGPLWTSGHASPGHSLRDGREGSACVVGAALWDGETYQLVSRQGQDAEHEMAGDLGISTDADMAPAKLILEAGVAASRHRTGSGPARSRDRHGLLHAGPGPPGLAPPLRSLSRRGLTSMIGTWPSRSLIW